MSRIQRRTALVMALGALAVVAAVVPGLYERYWIESHRSRALAAIEGYSFDEEVALPEKAQLQLLF